MKKTIIFSISSSNKKYYFNQTTEKLPILIKDEIKLIGINFVEKIGGIFNIGFYQDGSLFFQSIENDLNYDEIGAKLEIEKIKKQNKDLITSLQIWYKLSLLNIL